MARFNVSPGRPLVHTESCPTTNEHGRGARFQREMSIHVVKSPEWRSAGGLWAPIRRMARNAPDPDCVARHEVARGSGVQRRSCCTRALARTTSFRMTAVMATLGGLPAASSASYFRLRPGFQRIATSAGM